MKRFSLTRADVFTLLFAPAIFIFQKKKRPVGIAVLLLSLLALSGCFRNYFKINSRPVSDSSSLATLKNSDKYFVIHLRNGFFALKNISANGSRIEGDLQTLPAERERFIYASQAPSKTYKSRDKALLFSEVHLYAQNENASDSTHISIPVTSISRVDIFEKDKGKTIGSYVLGSLGIYAGIGLIFAIIVLATCNCPQVYTYDGNQYNFKSGVFSGAIYSSLEKTDYLPLDNLAATNGKYIFKIANNQKEEQFINQVQLVSVEHTANVRVLLDRMGQPHTYGTNVIPGQPEKMSAEATEAIKHVDGNPYMFNENSDPKSELGSAVINFENSSAGKSGKLIIHAKNSLWSGYIFDEFSSLFGSKYQNWIAKQDKASRQSLEQWQQEQALPLMVYIKVGKDWKFVDYFPFTGNTAGRDMIMQIPLPQNEKSVKVKIESAYMFWEMDYAAMDFSADAPVAIGYLNPSLAATSNNEIKMQQLFAKDKEYAALKEDESINVEFNDAAREKDKETSWFLSSTGYYHSTKNYSGKTQLAELYQFRKKGAFNKFSMEKFKLGREALAKGINFTNAERGE